LVKLKTDAVVIASEGKQSSQVADVAPGSPRRPKPPRDDGSKMWLDCCRACGRNRSSPRRGWRKRPPPRIPPPLNAIIAQPQGRRLAPQPRNVFLRFHLWASIPAPL